MIVDRIRTFLVSLAMMCSLAALSQTHYSSNVALGVKGGIEFSRVFFHPGVNQKLPIGGTAGVMFRYVEENHFGIVAELDWEQRGWEEDFNKNGIVSPFKYRRTLNYIQIPVLAHIYFGGRGRFYLNIGPEIGFFVGESTKANFNPADINSIPDFPTSNRMNTQMTLDVKNKVDYGISGGLGGEFFANQKHSVCLEARFYYGLGNIFSAKRVDPFSSSNSMSVLITAGYWFRIK